MLLTDNEFMVAILYNTGCKKFIFLLYRYVFTFFESKLNSI